MSALTNTAAHPIAYFCAEFGIESDLPFYAGGLGILAGDTLKQAADDQVHMVGVGLLYRGRGSIQKISPEGRQIDSNADFDPVSAGLEHVYHEDQPLFIAVEIADTTIWLRCWKKVLSTTVTLYLLDTETEQNQLHERSITHELYAGSHESQLKQQLLLGIGGARLLDTIGITPQFFHLNEGRPSFLIWELIRQLEERQGLTFHAAWRLAREKVVYTNHTLVAAGNNAYSPHLIKAFAKPYGKLANGNVELLLFSGLSNQGDYFSNTIFSLNSSVRASGVSKNHTVLAQQMWPEYHWTSITNGVHFGTWQSTAIAAVQNDPAQLWQAHLQEKEQLRAIVQERTGYSYDTNWLVVSWARRMAGYKRVDALFADIQRLKTILFQADQPVLLLIAGKAHTQDEFGKDMLQKIIGHMQTELAGHALFVPNYNIALAQRLTRGSDVWLNTPEMGKEACGTSGMKALSNGVLQCTVPDGWAAELDWNGLGWTLQSDNISKEVYTTLEQKIIPLFYNRENTEYPAEWVSMMQRSIPAAEYFSAKRMLREYQAMLYQ
ncbi:MAG: alpha-glucan family phosphorylase [Candidatus Pacebacteria bacterium]|nr:alpha-glucan family phosphorylase [Candidatus Paceibacterota bacterium]